MTTALALYVLYDQLRRWIAVLGTAFRVTHLTDRIFVISETEWRHLKKTEEEERKMKTQEGTGPKT